MIIPTRDDWHTIHGMWGVFSVGGSLVNDYEQACAAGLVERVESDCPHAYRLTAFGRAWRAAFKRNMLRDPTPSAYAVRKMRKRVTP